MLSRAGVITSRTSVSKKIGYVLLGVLVCRAATAGAQEGASVRARLTIDAEASCATHESVAAQVRAHSRRIELASDAQAVPHVHVSIRGGAGSQRIAELAIEQPDGARSERRLPARTCAAAVEALSLLIAMALDPSAAIAAAPVESAPATAPEATPPATTPDRAQPPATSAEQAAPAVEREEEPGEEDEREPDPAAPFARFAAGVNGLLGTGLAPRAMPGIGLYARLDLNGARRFAPALHLQLAYAFAHDLAQAGGEADFTLASAGLDACPLGLRLPPFSAHACASASLGQLTAQGSGSYSPRTQHRLWSSLGGRMLLVLALADWVELEAGFALVAPLARYRFAFRPEVFHRVAAVGLEGQLGVGARFP